MYSMERMESSSHKKQLNEVTSKLQLVEKQQREDQDRLSDLRTQLVKFRSQCETQQKELESQSRLVSKEQ